MDWIFDNLPIVFFIVISVASFIKSRMEARRAQDEAERMPPVNGQPEEEWFGPEEAWENPADQAKRTSPPTQTPSGRRSDLPPPLVKVSPLIPTSNPATVRADDFIPSQDSELSRQQELRDRLQQLREKRAVTSGGAAATKKRLAGSASDSAASSPLPTLRRSLRNRSQVRRALVTREILGPPVAMKRPT